MKEIRNFACRRPVFNLLWACVLPLLLCGCQARSSKTGDTETYDPDRDYFPSKVSITHSIGFDVSYHKHYKVLHLFRHYNDQVDTISYALVMKGTPVPEGFSEDRIVPIPVDRMASVSTTHLGMFELLEALPVLKGVETGKYISSQKIRQQVEEGVIAELAVTGMLNVETVIAGDIDLLIGVGYPNSQNDAYLKLQQAGIPVLLNADWQERDLLGRAEWLKLLAVLLNKETMALEKFAAIEKEYFRVLELVRDKVTWAPLTITGIAQGDAWHVAGGNSFAMNLLRTVRVDYPWQENKATGSVKLDFETVYQAGLEAEFWMTPGNARSLDEILARDTRYADFKALQLGNVYNVYGKYTEGGGNDYYESAVMNPHVVLKDVVRIFHPELLPDHQLVYYNKLR